MHKIEIAQQAIDISMRRRGRVQPFVTIEPRKTALLVVDMQTGFLEPGAVAEMPAIWTRRVEISMKNRTMNRRSPLWVQTSTVKKSAATI